MTSTVTERLVTRLAGMGRRRQTSRRGFLAAATLTGTALAVDPVGYLTTPQSAYAAVCGPDASCTAGYSAFCCSIRADHHNLCPTNTFAGGWWKADRSSFCGGAARYYIDCNAVPGHHFTCRCNQTNCDHRLVACNVFRYGQCNTQVHGVTAVVCRKISCRPPWQLYPGRCGTSSATDNNTAGHTAPCLTTANTYPALRTWPEAPARLYANHSLGPGGRLTSYDRHTTLVMGRDGNLALYNQDGVVWSTRTTTKAAGGRAFLHTNGELQVLDVHGTPVWTSHSATSGGGTSTSLRLYSTGRLEIWVADRIVWHTSTHTP